MTEEDALLALLGLPEARSSLSTKALNKAWPDLGALSVRRITGHGNFARWNEAISSLTSDNSPSVQLNAASPAATGGGSVEEQMRALGPWKKGPFRVSNTNIDAEWRSDLKWERVKSIAAPLSGKRVLDVGTGNGYFLLRAAGEGAAFTLGLEPSVHYAAQFMALNRCYQCKSIALLPVTSEEFVRDCAAFDTVLSMGVLYHRRSPIDHLMELKSFLKPGGQLVLETIVVPGEEGYSLMPQGRYAQMRNVWFLPSVPTLESWLRRLGFTQIHSSETVTTTSDEQRATDWTGQPSLKDFLDPNDPTKTIEGYPAPARVITVAQLP